MESHVVGYLPMIVAFPLSVISTNRILNTAISRKGTANSFRPIDLWRDMVALKRIGGHRTLFAGLIPTLLLYFHQREEDKRSQMPQIQSASAELQTSSARKALQEHFGITL